MNPDKETHMEEGQREIFIGSWWGLLEPGKLGDCWPWIGIEDQHQRMPGDPPSLRKKSRGKGYRAQGPYDRPAGRKPNLQRRVWVESCQTSQEENVPLLSLVGKTKYNVEAQPLRSLRVLRNLSPDATTCKPSGFPEEPLKRSSWAGVITW